MEKVFREEERLRQRIHGFSSDIRNHRSRNRFHHRSCSVRGCERAGQRSHQSAGRDLPSQRKSFLIECYCYVSSLTETSSLPLRRFHLSSPILHHHRDSRLLPIQTAQASGLRKDLVSNPLKSLPGRIVELYSSKNILHGYSSYEKRHYSCYDCGTGSA